MGCLCVCCLAYDVLHAVFSEEHGKVGFDSQFIDCWAWMFLFGFCNIACFFQAA